MDDFTVRGADQFHRLSKALKAAGRAQMRKELNAELRKVGKPLIPKTRAAAFNTLPKRGGFAAMVAAEPQRVQVRTGDKTAGVRIVVGKRRGGARAANAGAIRHPVFGKGKFVNQPVEPGWFDKTLEREAPPVARAAIEEAMQSIVDRIVREAK